MALHRQIEAGQVARVAMEQALGAAGFRQSVAIVVEDAESVRMFEGPPPPLLQRCGGWNEELRRKPAGIRGRMGGRFSAG